MSLLRLALVVAYLAGAALPCARADAPAAAPELMRGYAAAAVHSHGDAPASSDGELRAPCPCGCDESPLAALASGVHGNALLPAYAAPQLPRAAHAFAPAAQLTSAPAQLPDPVPRLA
jgi:hypothetical protein